MKKWILPGVTGTFLPAPLAAFDFGVLQYNLVEVDGQVITPAKILMALLFFAVGILISKLVSRMCARALSARTKIEYGAVVSIQKLLFYSLVVIFSLTAFKVAGVPLTIFTVVGGALALGVGFGSQNVVNNFISGLILLIERPIKVGDLVEIEGVRGVVDQIGMRSVMIQTPENMHLIVPNSSFLEKNVINWTLSDKLIRCSVQVGVAYGSDTETVKEILYATARDHTLTQENPEPEVFFDEFGDNALLFTVTYWIRVRNLSDRRRIASETRFTIEKRFREKGITVAFPQRDVHLDTSRPLEVKLLSVEEKD